MLKTIQTEYNNFPCYIAENGMGVQNEKRFIDKSGKIDDFYRIDFINEHLY
jgi:beta-glucosidase/6-phospho-beta-glucosidase/beta-galactosidase